LPWHQTEPGAKITAALKSSPSPMAATIGSTTDARRLEAGVRYPVFPLK
jgi:hypothetical protein